ncbi:CHASE domain-containing protein [Marilutibacter chinensis]|uniref:histidine kinase n=1 Tax=Marilutibacter chinensis TaxID=2912247 RepID=A0ABS9HPS8_9GAMM|nr:CHASE domain-containing protein [Lysobacter chinensis]MCF7220293.1 CHASE domain-containing protein [Lysobacter chinensis]
MSDPGARLQAASGDDRPMSLRRGHVLALGVLVFSLLVTFGAWEYAREKETRAAETEFVAITSDVAGAIDARLENYEIVLKGGAALFASVDRPTPLQWQAYAEGMRLGGRFPSMSGLGYAAYVPHSRLPDLQLEWKDAGYGLLDVFPRGTRRFYGPVLYLEPRTPVNVAAVGYDMMSDAARHRAMSRAMESGTTQMSGPVHLLGDPEGSPPGLLLYVPIYRNGAILRTPAARRDAMRGWVYAPFYVDHFVESTLGAEPMVRRFSIHDVSQGKAVPVYASGPSAEAAEEQPAFVHQVVLEQFGRRWQMEFESVPSGRAIPRLRNLYSALALGIFASILLSTIVWALARTERRARQIARLMTEDYKRSEERFRTAMQYSAIGKALLDSDGSIVEANPALGRIVGLEPGSLAGVDFESLFEDEGPDLKEWLAGDEPGADLVKRATRRLHRAGDLPRHVQLTCARIPGNIGQDVRGLVQAEDVTERILAEARVHALNRTLEARVMARTRELSQANQELESFAYSISHDLRAPLRAIDGFSRVLAEQYGDRLNDAGRAYLGRVRAATGRMADLIDALLTMSRLSRVAINPGPVDLSQLAREVVDELQADEQHPRLQVEIAPGLRAWGDAPLLRNLLSNLIGNAIKFSAGREAPRIEIGRRSGPGGVDEFFVRDNGAGFPQEYAGKLFRPFQRLHGQDEFAGHGIGLASVKRIVERHGGSIRAEGRVDGGAIFYFSLPDEAPAAEDGV